MPSGGIGPHDLRLLPDGSGLIVANGGIMTGPGDREKLNIPFMRPNIARLSPGGALEQVVELPAAMQRASIRHLAIRRDGLVAFAMQWEGDPVVIVPLVGLWRPGQSAVLAQTPPPEAALMQGYAGSVAWSGDGGQVAITSPKGGRLHRFDPAGRFLGAAAQGDVCGVAPLGTGWLLSDGTGALTTLDGAAPRPLARHELAWGQPHRGVVNCPVRLAARRRAGGRG